MRRRRSAPSWAGGLRWSSTATRRVGPLGIDRFAVVGYSAGAPYAIAVAAGAPARVRGVGLMAGAGPVDDRDGARDGMAPFGLRRNQVRRRGGVRDRDRTADGGR